MKVLLQIKELIYPFSIDVCVSYCSVTAKIANKTYQFQLVCGFPFGICSREGFCRYFPLGRICYTVLKCFFFELRLFILLCEALGLLKVRIRTIQPFSSSYKPCYWQLHTAKASLSSIFSLEKEFLLISWEIYSVLGLFRPFAVYLGRFDTFCKTFFGLCKVCLVNLILGSDSAWKMA